MKLNVLTEFMMSCDEATHLISESLDRKLSLIEKLRLLLHNKACVVCQWYLEQLTYIHRHAKDVHEFHPGAEKLNLTPEAKSRIGHLLKEENHQQ